MTEKRIAKLKKLSILPLTLSFLFVMSCVKDNFDFDRFSDRVSYQPSLVMPAVHGSLTLGNMLESNKDITIAYDADSMIIVSVYEDSLFSISLNEILEIPDPEPVTETFHIDPVAVADFETSVRLSLGDMAERMDPALHNQIIELHGTTEYFPALNQSLGEFNVDPFDKLEYAHFSQGTMIVEVFNELPVTVDVQANLYSLGHGYEHSLGTLLYEDLGPGETLSDMIDLADKYVYNDIRVEIVRLETDGSATPVDIDIFDGLVITARSEDARIKSGRAMIPPTVISSESSEIEFLFGDESIEISSLKLKEGVINYALPDIMGGAVVDIYISNSEKEGQPFGVTIPLHFTHSIIQDSQDLAGVEFDFSAAPNVLFLEYTIEVGSDDEMVEFYIPEYGINLDMDIGGLEFDWATGYFGEESIDLDDEEIDLDFFDHIEGNFWFENPSIKLNYQNSVGVPVNLSFNLEAESPGREPYKLFDDDHPGFDISYPSDMESPPKEGSIVIDSGSNIREIISMPPSRLKFNAGARINPDGPGTTNFICSNSRFQIGMEIELPLELQISDLAFSDTVEVDFDPDDIDIFEKILMGLEVTNGFPLGLSVDIILYDSINDVNIYNFENIIQIAAADVGTGGFVIQGSEKTSQTQEEITGSTIDDLRRSTHFIISATMNTGKFENEQVPVKFQTYNKLDFRIKLKADMNIN